MNIVIIGAGPAGLAAAYELATHDPKKRFKITILDKNSLVGGLARTIKYRGCFFDVGPHRFYTKNDEVLALWKSLLGPRFLPVKRLTHMLYRDKLFLYPISLIDVAFKLNPFELISALSSFLFAKVVYRTVTPVTFEQYITKHFGKKMFSIFFKTYTEKIWGIKCDQIAAKWASQRIKNLNLWEVLKASLTSKSQAKTLVDEFSYPVTGSGLMYEILAEKLKKIGVKIILNAEVVNIQCRQKKITAIVYNHSGRRKTLPVDMLFSSIPITNFVLSLIPKPPSDIITSAKKIFFRDHITVNLILQGQPIFPDNWIYIHDPSVKMARVTNYNSMSPAMTPASHLTAVSVEYFAFRKDEIWRLSDSQLVNLAKAELTQVKLVDPQKVLSGFVVRETDSYPVYYTGHETHFDQIKKYVTAFSNLELIGRGGMFKYNNMDHAIYSGLLAARNVISGTKKFNTWSVNEDAQYLEDKP